MKPIRSVAWMLLATAVAGVLIAGCGRKAGHGTHFGEPFTSAPVVTIAQLLETPEAFQRKPVRVQGTIERQCPMAGCWFFIHDGQGRSIKVELGDYLPKLPQNIGNIAEAEGELIKKGAAYEFIGTRVTFTKKDAP
ncbi:MAG: DUF4920 domain-containing protein [Lentisphaerae bacterium]|nr:DUF4920 domain-containing protein [Lentisphaerota bacterium]